MNVVRISVIVTLPAHIKIVEHTADDVGKFLGWNWVTLLGTVEFQK